MTQRKAAPKFGVDDTVRFIGADTALTVRQIDQETLEYKVQLGDDAAEVLKQFAIERVQVYTPWSLTTCADSDGRGRVALSALQGRSLGPEDGNGCLVQTPLIVVGGLLANMKTAQTMRFLEMTCWLKEIVNSIQTFAAKWAPPDFVAWDAGIEVHRRVVYTVNDLLPDGEYAGEKESSVEHHGLESSRPR